MRLYDEVRDRIYSMSQYLETDSTRRHTNTVLRLTVVTTFGLIGTVTTGFIGMNLIGLTEIALIEKVIFFLIDLRADCIPNFLHHRQVAAPVGLSGCAIRRRSVGARKVEGAARRLAQEARDRRIASSRVLRLRKLRDGWR